MVVPVKNCSGGELTVSVVVPAAVTVVAKLARKLLAEMFAFVSLVAKVEAVAAEATPVPVARPEIFGVVKAGEVIV